MTSVRETVSLNATPADIWSVIGDFDSLNSWRPAVGGSETVQHGTAKVRHLTLGERMAFRKPTPRLPIPMCTPVDLPH